MLRFPQPSGNITSWIAIIDRTCNQVSPQVRVPLVLAQRHRLLADGTQQHPLYFIPSRIEPTMPPTTPPCTASLRCVGMYSMSSCASLAMGRVCNQILPGPVRDARKIPSPPKIMFLIPG